MAEKIYDHDFSEALDSPEAIEIFMTEAFKTGNASHIAKAIGVIAKAKGMTQLAEETGLSREQLYRSLSEEGNPTLKTTLSVLHALGLSMKAELISSAK